nr:aspartate/glutamate racemase family protein [Kineococcus aurantiacus]
MLGGMSWESTAEYYRLLNVAVRDRLGGVHSARVVLDSVDFADVEELQRTDRWQEAGQLLAARARAVEAAGADVLLLCTNTMHEVIGAVEEAVRVPVLHIADATAAAVDVGRVGLLGTRFTMERAFYRDRLAGHGIEVLVPAEPDRTTVHDVIYDELVRGVVTEGSRRAYRDVIDRLVARGAQGVVLGCTEIELLVGPGDSPVPVFPTTQLHVRAAVDHALGGLSPR